MVYIPITITTRNVDGLKARIRARTKAQKERVRQATLDLGQEELGLWRALANKDTGYMAGHIVLQFTRAGFNYVIGLYAVDFVGHTNPVSGVRITFFYPRVVVDGGPHYAGNNFPGAARHRIRQRALERYRIALAAS